MKENELFLVQEALRNQKEVHRNLDIIKKRKDFKQIANIIAESIQGQLFINLRYYDLTCDKQVVGLATHIDQELRKVKISHDNGFDWIPLDDILSVQIVEDLRKGRN